MTRTALGGAILVLAIIAAVVFAGVAVHELNYASDHAYAYGAAKIIAWACGAGIILSGAVALTGVAFARQQ